MRGRNGFTMVELLVALAVSVSVMVGVALFIAGSSRAEVRGAQVLDGLHATQLFVDRLHDDVAATCVEPGAAPAAWIRVQRVDGDDLELRFARYGRGKAGELVRGQVTYRVHLPREGRPATAETSYVLRSTEGLPGEPASERLASGCVKAFEARVFPSRLQVKLVTELSLEVNLTPVQLLRQQRQHWIADAT